MRYETPVYFQKITRGNYDPETGNYAEQSIEESCEYAAVTSAGADTLNLVYGSVQEGSLVVRLQRPHLETFNRIRIGEVQYRVDFERRLRNGQVFVVSEVQ